MNPRELADIICDQISTDSDIDKTEVAGPGLLIFFFHKTHKLKL